MKKLKTLFIALVLLIGIGISPATAQQMEMPEGCQMIGNNGVETQTASYPVWNDWGVTLYWSNVHTHYDWCTGNSWTTYSATYFTGS